MALNNINEQNKRRHSHISVETKDCEYSYLAELFIEQKHADVMKMRTKTKYKKEKAKVEKMIEEKVVTDPVAKRQEEFYQKLFEKRGEDAVEHKKEIINNAVTTEKVDIVKSEVEPIKIEEPKVKPEKKIEEEKDDYHAIVKPQKRARPDPYKKQKQKLEEIKQQQKAEHERIMKEKEEREKALEESRKQRKVWSRKLQERGRTGQLRMANHIEYLLQKITKQ